MSKEKAPKVLPLAVVALGSTAVHLFMKNRKSQRQLSQAETKRQAAEQRATEMEKLAMRDSLTGLYTRRGLEKTYLGLQSAARQKTNSRERENDTESNGDAINNSLLLLDIDHFKEVNDTLGHDRGDDVLRSVAEVLKTRSRERDVPTRLSGEDPKYVSRWGGEEMALLLPRANEEDAVGVAEAIRQLIETTTEVTASIGVVELNLDLPLTENVGLADKALYAAKTNGRNQVVPYSSIPPKGIAA